MFARLFALLVLLAPTPLLAQLRWVEGKHYVTLAGPVTGQAAAGKIEVAEIFSYVCGACNQAHQPVAKLKAALPADAAFSLVHAAFNPGWATFQRGFVTAQLLGFAETQHPRMFAAIWDTAEIAYFDRSTGQLRQPAPTLQDLARFYAKSGAVTEAAFMAKAASAEVNAAVKRAEEQIKAWRVPSTPTFIVNGRYRIENGALGSWDELGALVNYLIGLERARLQKK